MMMPTTSRPPNNEALHNASHPNIAVHDYIALTTLRYTTLHCAALHYIALRYTVLHYLMALDLAQQTIT